MSLNVSAERAILPLPGDVTGSHRRVYQTWLQRVKKDSILELVHWLTGRTVLEVGSAVVLLVHAMVLRPPVRKFHFVVSLIAGGVEDVQFPGTDTRAKIPVP